MVKIIFFFKWESSFPKVSDLRIAICCCFVFWYATHLNMPVHHLSWRRHQMKTFSALMALCTGNPPVTHKPATRKMFPFDDVIMWKSGRIRIPILSSMMATSDDEVGVLTTPGFQYLSKENNTERKKKLHFFIYPKTETQINWTLSTC